MSRFLRGDTYFGPLQRTTSIPHLWIIISQIDPETDKAVAVNVTSFENNQGDTSCVLNPGEHPFVRKQSVINYDDAQLVDESSLQRAEAAGYLEKHEPAEADLILKIQQGALTSDYIEPRLAAIVQRHP